MKSKILIFICIITHISFGFAQLRFTNFEANIPPNFSTNSSINLTTSQEHFKSSTRSLKWSTINGNRITVTGLNIPSSEVGSSTSSSAQLFIYNPELGNDTLIFEFFDNNGVLRRKGVMLLNFKGWRDYHRSYRYDYNNGSESSSFLLNECRISYKSGTGNSTPKTLFFDDFEFIGNTEIRQPGPHMALDYRHFKIDSPQDPLGAYLKKNNIIIPTASSLELSGLQTVKGNYARTLGNVTSTAVSSAKTFVSNCGISRNTDGTIKGRGLLTAHNPDTLVLFSTHIQSLARAFIRNNDVDAKDKLLLFTEYIIDQGVAEGGRNDLATNAYTNARAFPVGFFEALSIYPEPLRTDVINLLKWSHEYNKIYEVNPIPGQNIDFVHIKLTFLFELACSLTSSNEAVSDLKFLKNFLERNVDISQGFRDGIKPDGTGFHHKSHQMSYLYAFATWVDRAYALRATTFKVNKAAYDNMVLAYKNIFLQSSKGGIYANAGSGRTPFQAKVPINQTQFRRLVEIGGDIIGVNIDPDLAAFYNYTYGIDFYPVSKEDYDGFYASNYANLGVFKRGNWTVAMKGLTSYLFGTEIYPEQNRYGRYQSYGALEVLYNGTLEDSGYILNGDGWNWNYMPGTTTVVLPFNKLQAGNSRADEYQVLDFAGSLSLGRNGIFGLDFQQRNSTFYTTSNLKFKKSVFAFDNILICLGSDISVTNNQGSVVSTLFQTVNTTATPEMYVNSITPRTGTFASSYTLSTSSRWLTNSQGTGFYLAQGNNDYRIELGTQTTPDYTSLTGAETNTANFTRAYLVHGNQPATSAPAKYEYVVAPGVTPDAMKTLAETLQTGSVYTVLNQNSDYHAIKYIPDNTTAYVFFKALPEVNVGLLKSISNQSIVSIKEYDFDKVLVTINNPNLNPVFNNISGFISNAQLTNLVLNGNYSIISNPNNATINAQANILTVGFTLKDGFSASILLQKNVVTPINSLEFKGSYQPNGIQLNWESTAEKDVSHFILYRSDDGTNFTKITSINAVGNTLTKTNYNYLDLNFSNTTALLYYKIQSIDTNGTISLERVTTVKLPLVDHSLSFYPNPVTNVLNISLTAQVDDEIAIKTYALDGRLLESKKRIIKKGNNLISLNLAHLVTSEYIIKIIGAKIINTYKFIKL